MKWVVSPADRTKRWNWCLEKAKAIIIPSSFQKNEASIWRDKIPQQRYPQQRYPKKITLLSPTVLRENKFWKKKLNLKEGKKGDSHSGIIPSKQEQSRAKEGEKKRRNYEGKFLKSLIFTTFFS